MKFLHIKLVGYVGLYAVMGLETMEIDFTKCKHNAILIHGKNGSGKSTLMNALNPFPDSSSMYMPNRDAEKHLVISHERDIYEIHIFSKCKANGTRETTKAYVLKNGCELNENGNVNSFKDIIFSEFELDSNYVSLMQLSGTNRGLGSKTPAERKKFVANILGNMETYNNMYKTLNKKSLIYKSHVNTLATKIQNIGSQDVLNARLAEIMIKKNQLVATINDMNNNIVALQTKISIDDESAAQEIKSLKEEYEIIGPKIQLLMNQIHPLVASLKIKETDIEKNLQESNVLQEEYKNKFQDAKTKNQIALANFNTIRDAITELEATLEINKSSINSELEDAYTRAKTSVDIQYKKIKESGFNPEANVDHLKELIESSLIFIKNLDVLYDGMDSKSILMIGDDFDANRVKQLKVELDDIAADLEMTKFAHDELLDISKKISILDNRPAKCKIESCFFVKDSIKLKKELGDRDVFEELGQLQEKMVKLSKKSSGINELIDSIYYYTPKYMDYGILKEQYLKLSKLYAEFNIKLNPDFNGRIHNMDPFNEIRDTTPFSELYNLLISFNNELEEKNRLEIEYNNNREKIKAINSATISLDKKKGELESINQEIQSSKNEMIKYQGLIDSLSDRIMKLNSLNTVYSEWLKLSEREKEIKDKEADMSKNASKSIQTIAKIEELKSNILVLQDQLKPIQDEENQLNGQLTLLDSYNSEYNDYKSSYELIETLKKYCSPTNGGIQTIFMQIYMSKTLEICNQILGMMFNGEYQLLDFIINENEFRIPFIGSRLQVDDISSGSTSQICMMGMIINLVLAHQASSTFNIPKLDEVDGGLDHRNRYEFINTLYAVLPMLNIEQIFIVSHSMETDASAVDMIQLMSYSDNEGDIIADNIIWNYYDEIRKGAD